LCLGYSNEQLMASSASILDPVETQVTERNLATLSAGITESSRQSSQKFRKTSDTQSASEQSSAYVTCSESVHDHDLGLCEFPSVTLALCATQADDVQNVPNRVEAYSVT
jgi:hypothetical protein